MNAISVISVQSSRVEKGGGANYYASGSVMRVIPPRVEMKRVRKRGSESHNSDTLAVNSRSQSRWPSAVWSHPSPALSNRCPNWFK